MVRRPSSVAVSTVIEQRILRPNRVEELRPMSHPAAGCAAIILEPEGGTPTVHNRCDFRWSLHHLLARVVVSYGGER